MSSDGTQTQPPRILKAASLSGDVFVVPGIAGGLAADDIQAVPFIPPRLDALPTIEAPGLSPLGELAFVDELPADIAPPPADPTPELLAAAEAQAAGIVAAAEGQAAALVQQARRDAAQLLEEAKQQMETWEREAFADGYRQGMAAAEQAAAGQLQLAASMLAEAQQATHGMLADMEPEVIRLVLAVAQKVIRREIALDQQIVVETVKESLRRLGGRAVARVRISPIDVEALNEVWHTLTPLARDIELVPDDRIAPGGCVVESRNGEIDAQVDTQLAAVGSQLTALAEASAQQS